MNMNQFKGGLFSSIESDATPSRRPLRYAVAIAAVLLCVSGLGVRLAAVQLDNSGARGAGVLLADGNRVVEIPVTPPRGLIFDRAGRVVAKNVATYAVQIRPGDLPLPIRSQVVATLASMLNEDPAAITIAIDRATGSLWDPVRVANNVDERVTRLITEEHEALPGVEVVIAARRTYPFGPLMSAVVGYTGPIDALEVGALAADGYTSSDQIGRAGVESTYERQLRGTPGVRQIEVDTKGRTVRDLGLVSLPVPGSDVVLTIDTEAQRHAYDALAWGVKAAGNRQGVVAATDPQSGEMIALATLPTYDANLFSEGITNEQYQAYLNDKNAPLLNHAVGSYYPPGSTYKLVTYSCALDAGLAKPTEKFATAPYLEVGGQKFYEWNKAGFGRSFTMAEGFSYSSAVVTYQLAQRIKIDRLASCGDAWGFGASTGIDLPGELDGVVPDQVWARATISRTLFDGEVLQSALGQGYDLATPLQVMNSFSALANGGTRWRLHVVKELHAPDGTVTFVEPTPLGSVGMKDSTYSYMRAAARKVVTNSYMTANLGTIPLAFTGKTGTAEYGVRDKQGRLPFHNWISGFVAADENWSATSSRFAYVVFMHGSNTVRNAAIEVLKLYLQKEFNLTRDYRIPGSMRKGNYYGE